MDKKVEPHFWGSTGLQLKAKLLSETAVDFCEDVTD